MKVIELSRDFCPYCLILNPQTSIKCIKCGSEDLIPNPHQTIPLEEEEEFTEIYGDNISPNYSEIDMEEAFPEEWIDVLEEKKPRPAPLPQLRELFAFATGPAGSGKTFNISLMAEEDPNYIELCATTGIAAINLGGKTINSALKYFNTKSLENQWREQLLHMNLRKIRARKRVLGIEECSMMPAEQLDLIMNAVDDINQDGTGKQLGVHLIGDLCQLPPVSTKQEPAKMIVHSDYWDRFAKNTAKLDKIWRQNNPEFIRAINLIRAGNGRAAMSIFKEIGVTFRDSVDQNFEGTTLIPLNEGVDSFNEKRLNNIPGLPIRCSTKRLGEQTKEWEKFIPFEMRFKIGAYVMILHNDVEGWKFVNGDCGWIEKYDKDSEIFTIKLKRNDEEVKVGRITRLNLTDKEPDSRKFGNFVPERDYKTNDWVIGKINYHPLRLAYASTIHKSQGLSLDMVQIDARQQFFGNEAMGYVSISRARTPEGLVLVGNPAMIGAKIKMNKDVIKYV